MSQDEILQGDITGEKWDVFQNRKVIKNKFSTCLKIDISHLVA
jgi:hypothetical protein